MLSSPEPNASNPFSTSRVRPGALPYLFPAGEDVSTVLARLAATGWRGQIVGPHGSGKSTLLAELLPAIESSGKPVVLIELHDGQRRLPQKGTFCFFDINTGGTAVGHKKVECPLSLLAIDGYEQLPWWRRWLLQRRCRRLGVGLLVTSHRSVGLPEIFRTRVDAALARQIVARLLAEHSGLISGEEIDDCVRRHGQDLREALFELYDLYERRRGHSTSSAKV